MGKPARRAVGIWILALFTLALIHLPWAWSLAVRLTSSKSSVRAHVLQAGFLDTGTTTKSDLLAAATTGGLSRLFTDQLLQKMRSALGLSAFLKSASDPEEAKQTNAAD